jgi:hypothetical protein
MRFTAALVASLVVAACGDRRETHRAGAKVEKDARRWSAVAFDTLWIVGGVPTDTLFGRPSHLASLGALIVFSDPGYRRVGALHAATGRIAWISGGRGRDESLFGKPLMLAAVGQDTLVVVDDRRGTMTYLDRAGRPVRAYERPTSGSIVNSICAMRANENLIATTGPAGPVFNADLAGRFRAPVSLSLSGHENAHPLVLQGQLVARHDRSACAMSLDFGNWIALLDGRATVRATRFPEQIHVPRVDTLSSRGTSDADSQETIQLKMAGRVREATLSIASVPGRFRVLFGGETADAARIIDDYDDKTLEYLGSIRLPLRANSLTTPEPETIVLLAERQGTPMIIALRQRAVRP